MIGYLYGAGAQEVEADGFKKAEMMKATHLLGDTDFPAGLFTDERHAELSAVIFTNAYSMAKLARIVWVILRTPGATSERWPPATMAA